MSNMIELINSNDSEVDLCFCCRKRPQLKAGNKIFDICLECLEQKQKDELRKLW